MCFGSIGICFFVIETAGLMIFTGVPWCSCSSYQSWLVSIHLYMVISVNRSQDGHKMAHNCCIFVCYCLSGKMTIWYEEKPHQCWIRQVASNHMHRREKSQGQPIPSWASQASSWLAGQMSFKTCCFKTFQVQSLQNQCPLASTTWGQGIKATLWWCLSFWSMEERLLPYWLWPFSCGFRHMCADVGVTGMRHLILPQAFEEHGHLWVVARWPTAWPWFASPFKGSEKRCNQHDVLSVTYAYLCHDASSGMPSCTWIAIGRLQINTLWKCVICKSVVQCLLICGHSATDIFSRFGEHTS